MDNHLMYLEEFLRYCHCYSRNDIMKETSSLDEDDCANIVCDKDVLCIVVDAIVTVHLDQYYQCSEHLASWM